MPHCNDGMGLGGRQNRRMKMKNMKGVIRKIISGPSREHAILKTSLETQTSCDRKLDVTFPAVVKSFSNREAHHGPGRSTAHGGI